MASADSCSATGDYIIKEQQQQLTAIFNGFMAIFKK
jgi:hypothetical protein